MRSGGRERWRRRFRDRRWHPWWGWNYGRWPNMASGIRATQRAPGREDRRTERFSTRFEPFQPAEPDSPAKAAISPRRSAIPEPDTAEVGMIAGWAAGRRAMAAAVAATTVGKSVTFTLS